jgi:ribosomal protein S18 acetylase RimI-like enzyme
MNLRRSLREADIPSIQRILEEVGVFTPEEVACGVELAQQTVAGEEGYHWVLAEEDSELLGLICYGSVPLTVGTWDLYWILRSPRGKKQGVAARLLEACEEDINNRNARLLVLNTSGTLPYQPARDFYLRHGFRLTARIPEYYRPGDDLLIFTKKMGSG